MWNQQKEWQFFPLSSILFVTLWSLDFIKPGNPLKITPVSPKCSVSGTRCILNPSFSVEVLEGGGRIKVEQVGQPKKDEDSRQIQVNLPRVGIMKVSQKSGRGIKKIVCAGKTLTFSVDKQINASYTFLEPFIGMACIHLRVRCLDWTLDYSDRDLTRAFYAWDPPTLGVKKKVH